MTQHDPLSIPLYDYNDHKQLVPVIRDGVHVRAQLQVPVTNKPSKMAMNILFGNLQKQP